VDYHSGESNYDSESILGAIKPRQGEKIWFRISEQAWGNPQAFWDHWLLKLP
jgi:hypothetical protein